MKGALFGDQDAVKETWCHLNRDFEVGWGVLAHFSIKLLLFRILKSLLKWIGF